AARWAAENRPSDLLLPRGKPLGEAETLLQQGIVLDELETDFIKASVARAKRTQQLKSAIVVTLAGMAIVAGSAAFWAQQQRNLAMDASRRAEVEAETARQTTDFMVGLFDVLDPGEARGNTVTVREIMDRGAERIARELTDQPAVQATLMETMGTVYMSLGLYDQAASLLQSALDQRRTLYGDRHLEVARSLHRLGEVLKLKAEYQPAESLYREALSLRRELLGTGHVETAR